MEREWTVQELTLFCDIQTVAAITGLPIVVSALKHLSKHPQQKVGRSTILEDIKQDEDFKKAGYEIGSEKTIEDAIESLIKGRFLLQDEEMIMLDKKGLDAINILKLNKD